MEDGLPGLPQLVQQAADLRQHLTRLFVREVSDVDNRPGLLLEELYLQVHGLRGDLDRLSAFFELDGRGAPVRQSVEEARLAVDRLARALMAQARIRAEFLGQGDEPHEAGRMWEAMRQAIGEIGSSD